jgi:hypothetical protein
MGPCTFHGNSDVETRPQLHFGRAWPSIITVLNFAETKWRRVFADDTQSLVKFTTTAADSAWQRRELLNCIHQCS